MEDMEPTVISHSRRCLHLHQLFPVTEAANRPISDKSIGGRSNAWRDDMLKALNDVATKPKDSDWSLKKGSAWHQVQRRCPTCSSILELLQGRYESIPEMGKEGEYLASAG